VSPVTSSSSTSHLSHLIKFLVAKKDRNELFCFGGQWSPSKDGGDPSVNDDALIRAAIRCTKELAQLDLSTCKRWSKFMEIHYRRGPLLDQREISVIFLPDTVSLVPTMDDFMRIWRQRQAKQQAAEKTMKNDKKKVDKVPEEEPVTEQEPQDESEERPKEETEEQPIAKEEPADEAIESESLPEGSDAYPEVEEKEGGNLHPPSVPDVDEDQEIRKTSKENNNLSENPASATSVPSGPIGFPKKPCVYVVTKSESPNKFRSAMLSLDGLLDYDEGDKFEATFEISLFAELFEEMLQRDCAYIILQSLINRATTKVPKSDQRGSRKRQRDEVTKDITQKSSKKAKVEKKEKEKEKEKENEETKDKPKEEVTEEKLKEELFGNVSDAPLDTHNEILVDKVEPDTTSSKNEVTIETENKEKITPKITNSKENNLELLQAYHFFDRNRTGYIKTVDLEAIIHSLGLDLPPKYVRDLVNNAADKHRKKIDYVKEFEKRD